MTVQGPDQTTTRASRAVRAPVRSTGSTGTRWPSATTSPAARHTAEDDAEPVRPPRGRSGARFPSAAQLQKWQTEDGDAPAEQHEQREAPVEPDEPPPLTEQDAPEPEPVMVRAGARFPSAAVLRRWEEEQEQDEPEQPRSAPEPAARADTEPTLLPEPAPLPGPVAAFVRPYVLTGRRTRAGRYLGLETLVSARRPGASPRGPHDLAHRAVVDLCSRPKSVAEVAALMMVPLGVARVLVGDLAQIGALFVHPAPTASGMPDAVLMKRVLHGLRRL